MKLFLSVFVSLFAFTAIADTHSDDELAVLESLNAYYDARRNEDWKKVVSMESPYLGKTYSDNDICEIFERMDLPIPELYQEEQLIEIVSEALSNKNVVAWFQGGSEFGPRALGNRSFLADPRHESIREILNVKIKKRELFRPFAPSVLREDMQDWFNINTDSPYMLLVANIKPEKKIEMTNEQKKLFGIEKLNIKRSEIPAVTHVDYSARIQTVNKNTNKRYHDLISKFKEKTGCPVVVNTSFNVRGEPIVNTPTDAFNCFMGTELDYLVIGNCVLDKTKQNPNLKKDYTKEFELD